MGKLSRGSTLKTSFINRGAQINKRTRRRFSPRDALITRVRRRKNFR